MIHSHSPGVLARSVGHLRDKGEADGQNRQCYMRFGIAIPISWDQSATVRKYRIKPGLNMISTSARSGDQLSAAEARFADVLVNLSDHFDFKRRDYWS